MAYSGPTYLRILRASRMWSGLSHVGDLNPSALSDALTGIEARAELPHMSGILKARFARDALRRPLLPCKKRTKSPTLPASNAASFVGFLWHPIAFLMCANLCSRMSCFGANKGKENSRRVPVRFNNKISKKSRRRG